jgi:hypothetical protein
MRLALFTPILLLCATACEGQPDGGVGTEPGGTPSPGGPAPVAPAVVSGGLTLERLDTSGECDALIPAAAPEPVAFRRPAPAGGACLAGISDGTGAIALGGRDAAGTVSWEVLDPGGARVATVAAAQLVPDAEGWSGLAVSGGPGDPTVDHVSIGPDGAVRHTSRVSPDPAVRTDFRWQFAQDPAGGGLVLFRSATVGGNHWHDLTVRRFDAAGAPRFAAPVQVNTDPDAHEPFFMAAGVTTSGDALVVYQNSAFLDVAWLDPMGAVVASGEAVERSAAAVGEGLRHELELAPLLDGSLALRVDGAWRRRYAARASSSEPAPDWLTARAGWRFRFTRANAGYAAMQPAGEPSPDCSQRIDLVAPSGLLCGRVTISEASGGGCTTGALDQGWDGTVVQQSARDACAYRAWPRLLAR